MKLLGMPRMKRVGYGHQLLQLRYHTCSVMAFPFLAGLVVVVPVADRSEPCCLLIASMVKCLPMSRTGSGYSRFLDDCGYISATTGRFSASSAMRRGRPCDTFTHWKSTPIAAFPP